MHLSVAEAVIAATVNGAAALGLVDRGVLREGVDSGEFSDEITAIDIVRTGGILNLSPLCGGLPPDIAWPYLKRVGDVVLPEAAGSSTADGLTVAFNDLINTKGA